MDSLPIVVIYLTCRREQRRNYTILRKTLRDESNPLDMPDARFRELFRISKDLYYYIYDEINTYLSGQRSSKLPPQLKILAALRFYATGCYQRSVGHNYFIAMSQTSICRVIEEVTESIETHLCHKWIKFPTPEQFKDIQKIFYEKTRYPGIIGAIDCTHIEILKPNEREHLYLNRKGNHSLNVQIICDYGLKILGVNPRYPGATHDSAIWEVCAEKEFLKKNWNNENKFYLIGDSGYPLQPWLMTPFRSPAEGSMEMLFNKKHNSARNCVERCIGNLKSVFRCLLAERKLRYNPRKVTKIINACCALHNMRLAFNVHTEDFILEETNEGNDTSPTPVASNSALRREAERIRHSLALSLHGNI